MKKFLVMFCVVTSGIAFGMDQQGKRVRVVSPHHLNEKFSYDSHLADFAHHSRVVKRLGGKELPVEGIELVIKTSVVNYQHYIFRNGKSIKHLQFLEKEVRDIILSQA